MCHEKMLKLVSMLFFCSLVGCVFQQEKTLTVGSNHWIGYEPLYLAQDMGFYQDASIEITELSSASQVAKLFEQGLIDVAALTLDEAIRLTFRSDSYEILWVVDYSFGGDAIIAQRSFSSMTELKGQRIGIEEGAVSKYVLTRAAQINKMSLDDFELVPVHLNLQEREFMDKNVEAVATFDPVKSRLLELGAKQLFSSREIPGEIVDILVIKKGTYGQFEQEINTLIKGYLKAVALINQHDNEALALLARRAGLATDDILIMLDNIHIPNVDEVSSLLYSGKPELQSQIHALTDFLIKEGELEGSIVSNHLMPSFKLDF